MVLKIGSTEMVHFSLFKRRFLFESGDRGLVLEQADGTVCLYATDASHSNILCAMPLGRVRDMRKETYFLFAPDEDKLLAAVGQALFAAVSLARAKGVDPEQALNRATDEFIAQVAQQEGT